MFKNYFYLRRAVFELNKVLSGSTITEIYSQEKNVLFISVPCMDYPFRHLLISTNPQSPFLLIRNQHHKAKKNVIHIFSNIQNSKIRSIRIAETDRIVNIELSNGNIQFIIMGNKTNINLQTDEGTFEYFKKTSESTNAVREELNFSDSIEYQVIDNDTNIYPDVFALKKVYPMISNEIKNELLLRTDNSKNEDLLEILKKIINEILINRICVGYSEHLNKTVFIPETFSLLKTIKSKEYFSDYNTALQYYISCDHKESNKSDLTKELANYFEKELSNLSNKLNKLSARIESGSRELEYSKYGNILLTNIYQIRKGMSKIILFDLDGSQNTIKLDPKLNAKQNINKYFEKSKDEKVNYQKSIELFKFTQQKYNDILNSQRIFLSLERIDEIEALYKKVFPQKEKIIKMETGLKFKYWHYLIDNLYNVYVGRDSKSNDYLSVKYAKQNDYWFHARGLPGSHVVLRVDNVKEGIPKPIIKKAASIAAFHSKAKTAGTASVSYTFAKFVYKKKGMSPGKVILTKENTLLVKPEIPNNCELISE